MSPDPAVTEASAPDDEVATGAQPDQQGQQDTPKRPAKAAAKGTTEDRAVAKGTTEAKAPAKGTTEAKAPAKGTTEDTAAESTDEPADSAEVKPAKARAKRAAKPRQQPPERSEPAPPPTLRRPAGSAEAPEAAAPVPSVPSVPSEQAEPSAAASATAATSATPPAPRLVTAEETLSRRQRKAASRLRARKVKRVIRRLDAWSVLKISFLFNLCVYAVSVVSSVILWSVARNAGVIDNIESFIEDLGAFETYEFDADLLFQGVVLGGAVLAVLATGLTALGAVLFNLISDLVGGIRITMIEEPGARAMLRPGKAKRLAARAAPHPDD